MTTEAALLLAIFSTPDDDLPRKVFADYLDETGRSERAAFIRYQVDLARLLARQKELADVPAEYESADELTDRLLEMGEVRDQIEQLEKLAAPLKTVDIRTLLGGITPPTTAGREWGIYTKIGWPVGHVPHLVVRRGFVEAVHVHWVDQWCGMECIECAGEGRYDPDDTHEQFTANVCLLCDGVGVVDQVGRHLVEEYPLLRYVRVGSMRPVRVDYAASAGWVWLSSSHTPYHRINPNGSPTAFLSVFLTAGSPWMNEMRPFSTEQLAMDYLSSLLLQSARYRS